MKKSELKSEIKKILNENFGLSGICYPSVLNSPIQKFSEKYNSKSIPLKESTDIIFNDLKKIKTAFSFLTKNSSGWLDKQNEETKKSFFRLHNLLGLGD